MDVVKFLDNAAIATVAIGTIITLIRSYRGYIELQRLRERTIRAEEEAYRSRTPQAQDSQSVIVAGANANNITTDSSTRTETGLRITNSSPHPDPNALFKLYNSQIESYQQETRSRATSSFTFAIVAMISGISFIGWGGAYIVLHGGWENVVAGSAITSIGGSLCAFIAKTFLDIHRLSLHQLNHYFQQPVLNSHILTALRVVDHMDDPDEKRMAYRGIVNRIICLIATEDMDSFTEKADTSNHPARGKGRSCRSADSTITTSTDGAPTKKRGSQYNPSVAANGEGGNTPTVGSKPPAE